MARVFEKSEGMTVTWDAPTDHFQQVFVSVIVHVREGHAVPFVQFARAGGGGDVHELLSPFVMQEHIGQQRSKRQFPGPKADVGISVVIHVAEIRTHRHEDFVQLRFFGHVAEGTVAEVAVELHGGGIVGQPEVGTHAFVNGHGIATRQKVRLAVVIVVEKPGGEAMA